MNPARAVLGSLRRWHQMRSLRRSFAGQPLARRSCPLCGDAAQRLLLRGDRDFIGVNTSQCTACGFVFSSPHYAPEVISDFYVERYRSLFKGQTDPRDLAVRQTYLAERAGFYVEFLDRAGLLPRSGGAVLDVGCGEGTLLRTLRLRRPDLRLAAVEPSVAFARHLAEDTGIPVVATLDQIPVGQRFDLVTLVHVLEHVHDPVPLLGQAGDRLGGDGRLYVDVPDLAAHASINDLHIAHCSHFSRHTLSAALVRAGLEVVEAIQHRPPTLPPSVYAVAAARRGGIVDVVPPDPDRETYAGRIRNIDPGEPNFWARELRAQLGRLK